MNKHNDESGHNLHERQSVEYISGEYYDIPLNGFNRLTALPNGTNELRVANKGVKVFGASQRLAGDTDFNFNEKT